MSDRGSFCTNYIYCKNEQFEKIKKAFAENVEEVFNTEKPIIAGYIRASWSCGEANTFEWYVIPKIQKVLEADLSIIVSVMCESELVCVYKITKEKYEEIMPNSEE